MRENIHPSRIFVTGNPTYEAMWAFLPRIRKSPILKRLELKARQYLLITAHRSENVDNPKHLDAILTALGELHRTFKREVIYPMHPRTRSKIGDRRLPKGVRIMAPLGFYDFNRLFMEAYCVLSDSGTAPEEAFFYKVPCVSLRMTTERPETVEGGAHIVAGLEPANIVEAVTTIVSQPWKGRYELEQDFSPSTVVINSIRSRITNFF
jgi:UDP-N-acetylglucosamine 2-epimerase (non-hydrolysing)